MQRHEADPIPGSTRPASKHSPPIPKDCPREAQPATSSPRSESSFPAAVFQRDHIVRPSKQPDAHLHLDLETPRLNKIHQHLWLAGLPSAARPLHKQKALGRSVVITEDSDEHLVWFESRIFIKPLPGYLLDYDYWNEHLCSDEGLRQSACGLLLSYAWLVTYECDLDIAQDTGLLSKDVDWHKWIKFQDTFLDNIDLVTMSDINKRYKYGELRLSRLNAIYRVAPPTYSLRNLIRGYKTGSTWYNAFFERHFRWMLGAFAIFSVLLSALQVGLATSVLQGNQPFQRASYGFMVFSLVAVVVSAVAVFSVWFLLFWYHLLSSRRNDKAVDQKRRSGISSP
ncbi:hypothetical protein B0T12DRAFT_415758 [Alternaria alternata]|jgi:hypothetical protein|nr:hypothetical protein B0T12DRAFT_415758 [Alternaria alternata]